MNRVLAICAATIGASAACAQEMPTSIDDCKFAPGTASPCVPFVGCTGITKQTFLGFAVGWETGRLKAVTGAGERCTGIWAEDVIIIEPRELTTKDGSKILIPSSPKHRKGLRVRFDCDGGTRGQGFLEPWSLADKTGEKAAAETGVSRYVGTIQGVRAGRMSIWIGPSLADYLDETGIDRDSKPLCGITEFLMR